MKKTVQEFCKGVRYGTFEDVLWAQENGGEIRSTEKAGCFGLACENDPQCQGHLQVLIYFPTEQCDGIIALSGNDIDEFAKARELIPGQPLIILSCECDYRDKSDQVAESYRNACNSDPPPKCPECGKRMTALVLCAGCGDYVSLDSVHVDHESGGVTHACFCGHDVPTGNIGDQYGKTGWCNKCAGTEQ